MENYSTNNFESELFMNESGYDSVDYELSDKCREFCGDSNDCFGEIFELSEIRAFGTKDNFEITITPPTIPSLTFTHWPKIRFEEFLCFIASIFSLWFGFSLVMLSNVYLLVVKRVKNITNKLSTKVTLNNNNNLIINNSFQMEIIRDIKNNQQRRTSNKTVSVISNQID
jgi:hypothetical protein